MKPMKAATWHEGLELRFPLLCSTKLDGIRCLNLKGTSMSAQMKMIPNKFVQRRFHELLLHGYDGELILGDPRAKDCYRKTNSAVMSHDGEPDVKLYVFDMFTLDLPYEQRLKALMSPGRRMNKHVIPLHHALIKNMDELLKFERAVVDEGYEGVMLRSLDGPYKQGRSTEREGFLFKMKRFLDDEAKVLEVLELMHNENATTINELGHAARSSSKEGKVAGGVMGSLRVECKKFGGPFEIGTGFTAEDREWFWKNRKTIPGTLVKFKYFPVGIKDLPRHPVYLGLRSKID